MEKDTPEQRLRLKRETYVELVRAEAKIKYAHLSRESRRKKVHEAVLVEKRRMHLI